MLSVFFTKSNFFLLINQEKTIKYLIVNKFK